MKTGNVIRIPFRSDLSREDEQALEAATEWILAELESSVFTRGKETGIPTMRAIAERELKRPRDAIHRRWAELFIRETNEIEFDNVRPEIRKLAARGNVTSDEIADLRCNSWEWELIVPALDDEAFVGRMRYSIDNCSPGSRPYATYDKAVCGLFGPELLKRFAAATREAKTFAEVIDNVREALGQKATHYLIVADDVADLVSAVETSTDSVARQVLQKIRDNASGDPEIVGEGLAHTYTVTPQLYALALAWAAGVAAGKHEATVHVAENGGSRIPCVVVDWLEFDERNGWTPSTGVALLVGELIEFLGMPLPRRS